MSLLKKWMPYDRLVFVDETWEKILLYSKKSSNILAPIHDGGRKDNFINSIIKDD
jgi:hypothetical protein